LTGVGFDFTFPLSRSIALLGKLLFVLKCYFFLLMGFIKKISPRCRRSYNVVFCLKFISALISLFRLLVLFFVYFIPRLCYLRLQLDLFVSIICCGMGNGGKKYKAKGGSRSGERRRGKGEGKRVIGKPERSRNWADQLFSLCLFLFLI